MPRVSAAAGVALAVWLVAAGCEREEPGPFDHLPPQAGVEALLDKPVPDFALRELGGANLTRSGLRGKVVLIDFWASWCGPCRVISPVLQSLHETYGGRGLVVVGANTSERGAEGEPVRTADAAGAYAKENGFTYTFVYGADDFMNACRVTGLPTLLLVDREGVVRAVQVGVADGLKASLGEKVEALLAGKK